MSSNETKYPDVMIDLETLGRTPDCVVLSAGFAAFGADEGVGPSVRVVFDPAEQVGRRIDPETVAWWMKQSAESRAAFSGPKCSLGLGLGTLAAFVRVKTVGDQSVRAWGNGSDFDNAILSDLWAWHRVRDPGFSVPLPWAVPRNIRCFRTLKGLPELDYRTASAALPRTGLHDAEADARWQAEVAVALLRNLRAATAPTP